MTYLKSPAELAASIGANSGGASPAPNDPRFISMLDSCMAKIEAVCETQLARASYIDQFRVSAEYHRNTVMFRTKAAFIDPATLVVTDPSGNTVNSDNYSVDKDKGTVLLDYPASGTYTIAYEAGFYLAGSVLQGTPRALRALLDVFALHYQRSFRATVSDKVPLHELLQPVYREIAALAYGRFQRPRTCLLEPARSTMTEIIDGP
jgi:hypothetical protein